MAVVFVTRSIPERGIEKLKAAGHVVVVSEKDGVLTREELLTVLKTHTPDALLSLLTDKIDSEVFTAAPSIKICANYAVGFDNINLADAKTHNVVITNTPGVLTDAVAEHTVGLIFAITKRIPEGDAFTRAGSYKGWEPKLLLGSDLKGKVLGILGAGRIGSRVAEIMGRGVGMSVIYYDIKQSAEFEAATGGSFRVTAEEVLRESDVVSIHVPLLDSTRHLINTGRLALMKKSAYLINTSRGSVIDEAALVEALKNGTIRGAALDVFENEPALAPGLTKLSNVALTPHTASATEETRQKMSEIAAENIIAFFEGKTPPNTINS